MINLIYILTFKQGNKKYFVTWIRGFCYNIGIELHNRFILNIKHFKGPLSFNKYNYTLQSIRN